MTIETRNIDTTLIITIGLAYFGGCAGILNIGRLLILIIYNISD